MLDLIKEHHVILGIVIYFLYSNAVQALSAPTATSSELYRWAFAFNHGLAGNIRYVIQKAGSQYVPPMSDTATQAAKES